MLCSQLGGICGFSAGPSRGSSIPSPGLLAHDHSTVGKGTESSTGSLRLPVRRRHIISLPQKGRNARSSSLRSRQRRHTSSQDLEICLIHGNIHASPTVFKGRHLHGVPLRTMNFKRLMDSHTVTVVTTLPSTIVSLFTCTLKHVFTVKITCTSVHMYSTYISYTQCISHNMFFSTRTNEKVVYPCQGGK